MKRCILSKAAIKNNVGQRKNDQRLGNVIGESRDKKCWRVIWDGNTEPQVYAKEYITLLKEVVISRPRIAGMKFERDRVVAIIKKYAAMYKIKGEVDFDALIKEI